MPISIEDQQRVFTAYQALFRGVEKQAKGKVIRSILEANDQANSAVVLSLGYDRVVSILAALLERGVFASELKAKLAFPMLYKTSPEQDARREASDAGAARDEAEILQSEEAENNAIPEVELDDDFLSVDGGVHDEGAAGFSEWASSKNHIKSFPWLTHEDGVSRPSIPSFYPTSFSLPLQHEVLSRVQRLLEECCYSFTKRHAPKILERKKWDCPEAIELHTWIYVFAKHHKKLPSHAFKTPSPGLPIILLSVAPLRHAAVHRLRISAKGISQMVHNAVAFAEALSDTVRASMLREVAEEIDTKVKNQELHKSYLESRLQKELDEIDQERHELEKREHDAIRTIVAEDEENMCFVSSLLRSSLPQLFDGEVDREERLLAIEDPPSPIDEDDHEFLEDIS
jgi:hypothetical protein